MGRALLNSFDVEGLYRSVFDDEEYASTVAAIANAIGARSFLAGYLMADGRRSAASSSGYWNEAETAEYYDRYALHDPWNQALFADWRPHVARDVSHIVTPKVVESSLLYQDFIRPHGDDTFHAIGVGVELDGGVGGFGFQRGKGRSGFEAEDVALLDSVARDLSRTLALRARFQLVEQRSLASGAALDAMSDPHFIVGADSRLFFANAAGEALLHEGQPMRLRDGRLEGSRLPVADLWHAALRQAAAENVAATRLSGPDGSDVHVAIVALPASGGGRRFLVNLSRPAPGTGTAERLRALYGLSPVEADIAVAIASGLSPNEIADRRGTSLHTVRMQIRMLGDKMGCSRQVDIARSVAALPRIAPIA